MILALHQPNFMPWRPFFEKLERSDVFIILTHCQYTRRNYQNRFNIGQRWFTMGINKCPRDTAIRDVEYCNPLGDWSVIKKQLTDYEQVLSEFDECINHSLMDTNIAIIRKIASYLGITTEIQLDFATTKTSTDRTIELCKAHRATVYYSGIGGRNYLEADKFAANGIELRFQDDTQLTKLPIVACL